MLALLLGNPVNAADPGVRYEAQPGSKVKIEGTSTLHNWTMDGALIGGSLELDPAFNLESPKPGKVNARVQAVILVRSLKSGKPAMDQRMQEEMKIKDHSRIEYRLSEMTLKEAPASSSAPLQLDTKGELTAAGVTNKISMPVSIHRLEGNKLKITGTTPLKMTDYGVQPPAFSILGIGLINTGNDIKVSFEWVTAKKD